MQPSANARSPWVRGRTPTAGPLEGNASADVCIVGSGAAGLTAGLLLAREGRTVIVVDEEGPDDVGAVTTTAHLASALDHRIFKVARLHGAKKAKMVVDALEKAIDRVEEICQTEGIPGFRRVNGHLICNADDDVQLLIKELKAAQAAGLTDVRLDAGAPLPFESGPALVFPDQGEVDAGAYLSGLADAFVRAGGVIFSDTHATGIVEGERPVVETADGQVECAVVILATDNPSVGRIDLSMRQVPHWTYGCAYSLPRDTVRRGLYWETGMPYHSVRVADQTDTTDLLIVAGEDHPAADNVDPDDRFDGLDAWVRARFTVGTPAFQWVGQVMQPRDHLPFFGLQTRRSANVYVIGGYSSQEITYATAGAMIVTDLIEGRFNICAEAFVPYRHPLQATATRVKRKVKAAVTMVDVREEKTREAADQPLAEDSPAEEARVVAPIAQTEAHASGDAVATTAEQTDLPAETPRSRTRPKRQRARRKVTVFRAPTMQGSRVVADEPGAQPATPRRRLGVH